MGILSQLLHKIILLSSIAVEVANEHLTRLYAERRAPNRFVFASKRLHSAPGCSRRTHAPQPYPRNRMTLLTHELSPRVSPLLSTISNRRFWITLGGSAAEPIEITRRNAL